MRYLSRSFYAALAIICMPLLLNGCPLLPSTTQTQIPLRGGSPGGPAPGTASSSPQVGTCDFMREAGAVGRRQTQSSCADGSTAPPGPGAPANCPSIPQASYTGSDPAAGWVEQAFSFTYEGPPNLPQSARYSFSCNIYDLWIFTTDQPLVNSFTSDGSPTGPRSELLFTGAGAFSTTTQLAVDVWVPSGATGVTVVQDKGPSHEEMEIEVNNGNFIYWSSVSGAGATMALGESIYDRWVHVNVLHDMSKQTSAVYLNGTLYESQALPGSNFSFKCGAYDQPGASSETQAYFANIKVYTP